MYEFADDLLRAAFYGALCVVVVWEYLAQFRPVHMSILKRWVNNFGIGALGYLAEHALLFFTGIGAALYAEDRDFGLLPTLSVPEPVLVVVSVLLMDMLFYWLHRLFHRVPLLWRIHAVHHSDTEIDASVAFRRHPLELVVNPLVMGPIILALGIPWVAILIFQASRAAVLFFEHANVAIHGVVDGWLRRFIVTPNMHRIHHSADCEETDSNYGDLLTWWDRLFGTYRASPKQPALTMTIGLEYFRSPDNARLDRMLLQPFASPGVFQADSLTAE